MRNKIGKKGWCFAIILLFVGASVVPSVMSGDTQKVPAVTMMDDECDWHVKEGGNNSNGGKSWEDAWADIVFAINNSLVEIGDRICVGDGTYYENIVINKKLKIKGNGSSVSIIDGSGIGNVCSIGPSIGSPDIEITGFTIQKSGPYNNAGICVYETSGTVIEKNVIKNNAVGIYVYSSQSCYIKTNTISNNILGIHLNGAWGNYIQENNYIENNVEYGIALEGSGENIIISNEIKNNSASGIGLFRAWRNDIRDNNFISNGAKGTNHIFSENCLNKWSRNYYYPRDLRNLGKSGIIDVYIIWGNIHSKTITWLYLPILIQVDWNAVGDPN